MSTAENKQAPRTAWINAMRSEVLHIGKEIPEVARVVQIGMWIATYADADGSNAFPKRDTLATLCGCSQDTVTNAVKVLVGVGALLRRRRPNASAMYQLVDVALLPGHLPWAEHVHHITDTRQRRAHAKEKAEAAREASMDASRKGSVAKRRKASTDVVRESDSVHGRGPEDVRCGGSEPADDDPESVRGRPRIASVDGFRKASTDAPTKSSLPAVETHAPTKNLVGVESQQQTREGEAVEEGDSAPDGETAAEPRAWQPRLCPGCKTGTVLRPDREVCGGCLNRRAQEARRAREALQRPVQGTFLVSLDGGGPRGAASPAGGLRGIREDPLVAGRKCGCGRMFRLADSDHCPDCLVAADLERRDLEVRHG